MQRVRVGLCATILFAVGVLQVWWPAIMSSSKSQTPDVIVVGGGLAGLCAAIVAEREGARVALVDKEQRFGGNSAKASSGMNGVADGEDNARGEAGDSVAAFVADTIASGRGLSDEGLVNTLVGESMQAIEFLESFGINLDVRGRCGGHSFARTYRNGPPSTGERFQNVGFYIVSKLMAYIEERPNISKITGARAVRLITDSGGQNSEKVVGVALKYGDSNSETALMGSAVVLATGGYGASVPKFHEGSKEFDDLPTTNGQFAVGDGLVMAQRIGAAVKCMSHVQVHPTSFVDPKDVAAGTNFLAAESLRGSGGLLINQSGKRFTNELGRRDEVTQAMKTHGNVLNATNRVFAYLLLNEAARDRVGPAFAFYEFKGFFRKYEGVDSFAQSVGMDGKALAQTLEAYTKVAESGGVDEFGKSVFPVVFHEDSVVYAAQVTPAIHYTMGGLVFSRNGEILDENEMPLQGLYGAGEVTGGLHGANRLGGNSLLECVVFGRAAGLNAAKFTQN